MIRFFFILLTLTFTFPVLAIAQEQASMRVNEREDYVRVVLSLPERVGYTLNTDDASFVDVTVNGDYSVGLPVEDFSGISVIDTPQIRSQNPLVIRFPLRSGQDLRDLQIGRRLIFDVYLNPRQAQRKRDVDPVQSRPAASQIVAVPTPPRKPAAPVSETSSAKAVPPEYVLVPEELPEASVFENTNIDEGQQPNSRDRLEMETPADYASRVLEEPEVLKKVNQQYHILGLRLTTPVDVATFLSFNKLYFVADRQSKFLTPGFSSPNPEAFSAVIPIPHAVGTIYTMDLPASHDFNVVGRDGGLVWTVVMGREIEQQTPMRPQYIYDQNAKTSIKKLLWPFEGAGKILDVEEERTGTILKVVTVDTSAQFAGPQRNFVDFDVLESPIGIAIRPKVDDLVVTKTDQGVEVYRENHMLAMAPARELSEIVPFLKQREMLEKLEENRQDAHDDVKAAHAKDQPKASQEGILKFKSWRLVTDAELWDTEIAILSGLYNQSTSRKVEDLLSLGQMFLAHGYGGEALGYLDIAKDELPGLEGSAEFRAMRGVAKAIDWKSESALKDFLHKDLIIEDEINLWRSFVLADLGDWQQAAEILPRSYAPLYNYPAEIGNRLALSLAEVNLRAGRINPASELLTLIDHQKDELLAPQEAAFKYLKGEAERQKDHSDVTEKLWGELVNGDDDLYRTKAGLALTILKRNANEVSEKESIDSLERLRYAWRGDELEAQVNYWLGDVYFEDKQYLKGLGLMRDAVAMAGDGILAERIASDMSRKFADLYLTNALSGVSPTEAVALFEEFSELTPSGERGDELVQALAERLVAADLLERATGLLEHQIDHRLQGDNKVRVALRLASIQLLDKNPQEAMNALAKANAAVKLLSETEKTEKYKRDIQLLRIRAYAQNKQYDRALSLVEGLAEDDDTHRLEADIAWQAGYWDHAAIALNNILIDQRIGPQTTLNDEQASIILNRSIALSLNDDRIALANMREKYLDQMKATNKAHQFEVITRPGRSSALADRDTLLSTVSEVDLFGDFLESYKASAQPLDGHSE